MMFGEVKIIPPKKYKGKDELFMAVKGFSRGVGIRTSILILSAANPGIAVAWSVGQNCCADFWRGSSG